MPIRHCQKCGLKVLIDEHQAAANPFHCQRCTIAIRAEERDVMGETPIPSRADTPSPGSRKAEAAEALPPLPSTVKVHCPYCNASFNGRVPHKPARGACPVCQKDLILLPTGEIRPAAGFDLNRWQQEANVMKYAAEPAQAHSHSGPRAGASAPAADSGLPSWLDDEPSPVPLGDGGTVDLQPADITVKAPPPPEPVPRRATTQVRVPPPALGPKPLNATTRRVAAPPASSTKSMPRTPSTIRNVTKTLPAPSRSPRKKRALAYALLAGPLVVGAILLAWNDHIPDLLAKLGGRFAGGLHRMHKQLTESPAPDEARRPGPPKVDTEQQRRDEEAIDRLNQDIRLRGEEARKRAGSGSEQARKEVMAIEKIVEIRKLELSQRLESYKKAYSKEYTPQE